MILFIKHYTSPILSLVDPISRVMELSSGSVATYYFTIYKGKANEFDSTTPLYKANFLRSCYKADETYA